MGVRAVNVRGLKHNPSAALESARESPVVVLKGDHPVALLVSLATAGAEEDLRRALARALYDQGVFSLGRAARLSGLSYSDFVTYLSNSGVPVVRYDVAQLEREAGELPGWSKRISSSPTQAR
ncbi:MAG: UPF0175 family protein [Chloroflexi bacterium]|nr:UPF0175 family protein [Chloroflexota bacterium]